MKWSKWLEHWDMTSLKIKTPILDMEWKPKDEDKAAAWDMYIELLTRITTQELHSEHGNEKAALDSIYSLFGTTRQVLKDNGRHCTEFAKIAIVVLNQIIRPFTAKWHKLSLSGAFEDAEQCDIFRKEILALQSQLQVYSQMLADIAQVEDLTSLNDQV